MSVNHALVRHKPRANLRFVLTTLSWDADKSLIRRDRTEFGMQTNRRFVAVKMQSNLRFGARKMKHFAVEHFHMPKIEDFLALCTKSKILSHHETLTELSDLLRDISTPSRPHFPRIQIGESLKKKVYG